MFNLTQLSKYRNETISLLFSFADDFVGGEIITGTPTISVGVFTGQDASPQDILYGGASILQNGTVVEQRVRLGVVGIIYTCTFSVQTTAGRVYEKECYLAILPEEGVAIPSFTNIWFTSWPYPYNVGPDSIQTYFSPLSGAFWYQPRWQDSIQSYFQPLTGNLFVSSVSYTNPHEDIQSYLAVNSGTLTLVVVTYNNYAYESLKSGFALIEGNIFQSQVSYTIQVDSFQSYFSVVSGTLT